MCGTPSMTKCDMCKKEIEHSEDIFELNLYPKQVYSEKQREHTIPSTTLCKDCADRMVMIFDTINNYEKEKL